MRCSMMPNAESQPVAVAITMDMQRDDDVAKKIRQLIAKYPRLAVMAKLLEWLLDVSTTASVTPPSSLCMAK